MSNVFEITSDDIHNALEEYEIVLTNEWADLLLGYIDAGLVEKAALRCNKMDEQIDAAYDEIRHQLIGEFKSNKQAQNKIMKLIESLETK